MEKNFYLKKRLQLGAGKHLQGKLSKLSEDVVTKVQDYEHRLKQVNTLTDDGLHKLYRGGTLSRQEQIEMLEQIKSASSTI